MVGFFPVLTKKSEEEILILFMTQLVLLLFIFLEVRISLLFLKSLATINHGSTAMQCPPTPGPGCKILTRG